jgi:hypothetical protein
MDSEKYYEMYKECMDELNSIEHDSNGYYIGVAPKDVICELYAKYEKVAYEEHNEYYKDDYEHTDLEKREHDRKVDCMAWVCNALHDRMCIHFMIDNGWAFDDYWIKKE